MSESSMSAADAESFAALADYKPKPDFAILKIVTPRGDNEAGQYEIVGTGSPQRTFSWLTDAERALHIDHYQYSPGHTDQYRSENAGSKDWVYVRFPS